MAVRAQPLREILQRHRVALVGRQHLLRDPAPELVEGKRHAVGLARVGVGSAARPRRELLQGRAARISRQLEGLEQVLPELRQLLPGAHVRQAVKGRDLLARLGIQAVRGALDELRHRAGEVLVQRFLDVRELHAGDLGEHPQLLAALLLQDLDVGEQLVEHGRGGRALALQARQGGRVGQDLLRVEPEHRHLDASALDDRDDLALGRRQVVAKLDQRVRNALDPRHDGRVRDLEQPRDGLGGHLARHVGRVRDYGDPLGELAQVARPAHAQLPGEADEHRDLAAGHARLQRNRVDFLPHVVQRSALDARGFRDLDERRVVFQRRPRQAAEGMHARSHDQELHARREGAPAPGRARHRALVAPHRRGGLVRACGGLLHCLALLAHGRVQLADLRDGAVRVGADLDRGGAYLSHCLIPLWRGRTSPRSARGRSPRRR